MDEHEQGSGQSPRSEAEAHRAAGERAMQATLWGDAVAEFEQCLSLAAGADDRLGQDEAALLTSLGSCYWNLSEARPAWRSLRRAIALFKERDDAIGLAQATVEILRIWGPRDRQRDMANEALQALGDGDPYLRARLLLNLRWSDEDPDVKFAEAMAIGRRHGYDDILVAEIERQGWEAFEQGRVDEAVGLWEEAHARCARADAHEPAAYALRNAAFNTLECGELDRGEALALRTVEYARSVHLRFIEQLGLVDAAGVAFARCQYERCLELLSQTPTDLDFRGDLYRAWIHELRGETREALALLVHPDRGGGATTAVSQLHAAAAGLLYRAGHHEAAADELRAWGAVAGPANSLAEEVPAAVECLVALGDDELVAAVDASFDSPRRGGSPEYRYATLQGRSVAPARGNISLRRGDIEKAEAAFADGLAWCERERCDIDAALCLRGLAAIATQRGDADAAAAYEARAGALFAKRGAVLWLKQEPSAR